MLIFAGKAYAKNEKEFMSTLFEPVNGQTANGFYKRVKGGYRLYTQQRELVAFVKGPAGGESAFVVSCAKQAGAVRYSYSTSTACDKFLGLDSYGYMATINECSKLFEDEKLLEGPFLKSSGLK